MSPKKKIREEMSFLQHLEELRWAILKSVLAILVGMVACFSFHEYIVEFLISPTLLEGLKIEIEMQAIRPAGMFTTIVNICLVGGFALALPYVLYQLWSFVSPGLLDNEKKYVPIVIFFSCVLFLMGGAFAFYILIPVMVRFFIQLYVPGISAQWDIGFWIGLVNKMVLIMGIVFPDAHRGGLPDLDPHPVRRQTQTGLAGCPRGHLHRRRNHHADWRSLYPDARGDTARNTLFHQHGDSHADRKKPEKSRNG